jgi:hypothetical protein
MKLYLNMRAQFVPLVYIRRRDYWGIEVTGTLPGEWGGTRRSGAPSRGRVLAKSDRSFRRP